MIKNKTILEMIEKKKQEISCENCKRCNLNAYHSGKWYCSKISVFKNNVVIEECFERRMEIKNGERCRYLQ